MSEIPEPESGMIISYSYLWRREHLQGREEGVKDRPCAIILSKKIEGDEQIVTVAPITHTEPDELDQAVEIPLKVKEHLNLDSEKSWIICSEVNRFIWPGPDLRRISGQSLNPFVYGFLPPKLFIKTKRILIQSIAKVVSRSQ